MLTIREAAEKTGHSPHKIRRLIKAIADQPEHADRSGVEPSPSDVERLNAEGVQFTWRISEELVLRQLGEAAAPPATKSSEAMGVGESSELLNLLQRAIDAKEQAEIRLFEQLRVKDEQIASLNERLHESNILMGSLQKQLPEAGKMPANLVEAAAPSNSKVKGKGTAPVPKRKRRTWLRNIFSA